MKTIKVIIKEPNEDAYVKEIPHTLKNLQSIVGGYIEVVPFGMDYLLVLDEEGIFKNYKPNIAWNDDIILGTLILVRNGGEEFESIKDSECSMLMGNLNRYSV